MSFNQNTVSSSANDQAKDVEKSQEKQSVDVNAGSGGFDPTTASKQIPTRNTLGQKDPLSGEYQANKDTFGNMDRPRPGGRSAQDGRGGYYSTRAAVAPRVKFDEEGGEQQPLRSLAAMS